MISLKTTTGKMTTEERKQKIAELKEYHQLYLDSMDQPKARFIAKMRYGFPPDRSKFFESEIAQETPLYVEWVSRDYQSEDDKKLYLYEYTPEFRHEFKAEPTDSGIMMYVVPTSKFKLVYDPAEEKKKHVEQLTIPYEIINPDEDSPMENMTVRDLAAIMLKIPVSRKEWLNKIIDKYRKI